MSVETIYGFLYDPIFIDRTTPSLFTHHGGVGHLSARALSYFRELDVVEDPRPTRTPAPSPSRDTRLSLLVDNYLFRDYRAQYDQQQYLFTILDRVFFRGTSYDTSESLDLELTGSSLYNPLYVPGSLILSTAKSTGQHYLDNDITYNKAIPDWVEFQVPYGADDTLTFKIWSDSAAFEQQYPICVPIRVVPPLPLDRLLTGPLVGQTSNMFDISSLKTDLWMTSLHEDTSTYDSSGVYEYPVTIYDTLGNQRTVSFLLRYKGAPPLIADMRSYVREFLLTSGVGTETQWRVRIPEVFISDLFYLIPQWDHTTTRPDRVLYKSVYSPTKIIQNTHIVMQDLETDYIDERLEVLNAVYNTLTVTSLPSPLNLSRWSLETIHPTYQAYPTTDPAFMYISAQTREFITRLNIALSVASESVTHEGYTFRTERGRTYVPFTSHQIEYCVMTRSTYLTMQARHG